MKHDNQCANCGRDRHPGSTLCPDCILACSGMKGINVMETTQRNSNTTDEVLRDYFITVRTGTEYILDAFAPLFLLTLSGLRGKFTDDELKLIIDTFIAAALTPWLAGRYIIDFCSDTINRDGIYKNWCVDKETFLEKLRSLTIFQAACLEIWASGFWYGDPRGNELDFDEWIKKLSGGADKYLRFLVRRSRK
ncbi:hypothetical protein ES705_23981 [subsurface metagenome]